MCRQTQPLMIGGEGRSSQNGSPGKVKIGWNGMGYRPGAVGGILGAKQGPTGGTQVTCDLEAESKKRKGAKKDAAKDTEQH